ncbi:MAG: hypothetical protein QNK04_03965 [Myxococcota bacterium]|nr:hypothetical protein [Myxococcota bacterium]
MSIEPRLTIVVENTARELDAKLLLACVAVERGFTVILGEKREIHGRLASLPRSVFLNKDVSARSRGRLDRVRRLGHVVAASDEEGLVYFSNEHYFKTKVGPETLARPELLFAWGDENAQIWREHPGYGGAPIAVTGNPRIDLLRPELRGYWSAEADWLRERLGRFVLINTNFGQLNNLRPKRSGERRILDAHARNPESVDAFDAGLAAHREQLFRHFQEGVGTLARTRPDVTVVVRPHPSESDEIWYRAAAGCSNTRVIHEGNAAPWLMAAEVVVHNGCTTGLETFVLDKPAIAFQPVAEDRYDKHLPNALSHRAWDVPGLLKLVDAALEGELRDDPGKANVKRELLEHWVAATSGTLAAERMADALLGLAPRVREPARRPGPGTWLAERARDALWHLGQARVRVFHPERHRRRAAYYGRVFPTPTVAELEGKIERIRLQLGRFDDVRIRPVAKHVFELGASAPR